MNNKLVWGAAAAAIVATPLLLAPAVYKLVQTVDSTASRATQELGGQKTEQTLPQRPAPAVTGTVQLPVYQAEH